MTVSTTILQNLTTDQEFARRVLPYLHDEYFDDPAERVLFKHAANFINKYNETPTYDALFIELTNDRSISEGIYNSVDTLVGKLKQPIDKPNLQWLVETTEKFCKERALHNSIRKSIAIFEGEDKQHDWGAIPDILTKALAVSFDTSIGHDYIADADNRFAYYHRTEVKVKSDIEYLNRVTKGGVSCKTLNLLLAGTHVGKTAWMCHMAAQNLLDGYNVLYITLEISEEEISKRIDANLFDVTFDELMDLPKDVFSNKIERIKAKSSGKLKVKEYPTASASVVHIKTLINELRLKQGFDPDIIYIDYINIMCSSRIKSGSSSVTSYSYMKAISEEVRGLAVECNVPVWSASQFNRGNASASDPSMEGIAESYAVNFVADFILAIVATEDLIAKGTVMAKQLKNRYDDLNKTNKFFVGFDRNKQRLYNLPDPLKGVQTGGAPQPNIGSIPLPTFNKNKDKDFGNIQF